MGEEHLTSGETVTTFGTDDLDADTAISVCMVKGAANCRAMGIVYGLILRIVNQKTDYIPIKAAVHKDVIAAVIDASVQTTHAQNIGEGVVFTEMGDIDAGTAVPNVAIRHGHGRGNAVTGICAGDTAAGEAVNKASTDDGMLRLILIIFACSSSKKRKTMARANLLGEHNCVLRANYCQIFYTAHRA